MSIEFVAVLARLLTRHGNRVGALLYGDRGRHRAAGARRAPARAAPAAPACCATGGRGTRNAGTDLGALLERAAQIIKRRSLVFVVSDFISEPGWAEPLALLAERHEVVAVRLYDPLESNLPDLGLLVIEDAETGEQLFVDTHDRAFRKRFAAAAEPRERELRSAFARAGVDASSSSTDDDLVDALLRFADCASAQHARAGAAMPEHLSSLPRVWRHDLPLAERTARLLSRCRCWWCCTSGCSRGARSPRCATPASRW